MHLRRDVRQRQENLPCIRRTAAEIRGTLPQQGRQREASLEKLSLISTCMLVACTCLLPYKPHSYTDTHTHFKKRQHSKFEPDRVMAKCVSAGMCAFLGVC